MEISATAGTSNNGNLGAAQAVPGVEMHMYVDKSGLSVYDLLSEMPDGDIPPDHLHLLEEGFREELDILAPDEELMACIIAGNRMICTVLKNEVSITHCAFSLRLSVVRFGHSGEALNFDAVRLPMSAPDAAAEWHLIDEIVSMHITPLAHKLAELYGPHLDARAQVKIETEANA
jgi:hypothetical protein